MKEKEIFKLLIILTTLLFGCRDKKQSSRIGLFDISKDDKSVLFSFYRSSGISILSIDLNGSGLREIIPTTIDSNFYNPKFNKDGSKILFIGNRKGKKIGCTVFLAKPDGSGKTKIFSDKGEITEAVFSDCEDKIYYIRSNEFGHSSPLGEDQPHNSDIYSINLTTKVIEQVTHLNAYSMYRVSEYDCGKIMMSMAYDSIPGLLMFSKGSPGKLISINPLNNPRKDNSLYNTPFYSDKFNMLGFIAPYELYVMGMKDKHANLVIYDELMVSYFRFFNKQKKLVYINDRGGAFYLINYDGSNLKEISIDKLIKQK